MPRAAIVIDVPSGTTSSENSPEVVTSPPRKVTRGPRVLDMVNELEAKASSNAIVVPSMSPRAYARKMDPTRPRSRDDEDMDGDPATDGSSVCGTDAMKLRQRVLRTEAMEAEKIRSDWGGTLSHTRP